MLCTGEGRGSVVIKMMGSKEEGSMGKALLKEGKRKGGVNDKK